MTKHNKIVFSTVSIVLKGHSMKAFSIISVFHWKGKLMNIPENVRAMPTQTPKIQFRIILIYICCLRPTSSLKLLEMSEALIFQLSQKIFTAMTRSLVMLSKMKNRMSFWKNNHKFHVKKKNPLLQCLVSVKTQV